MWHRGNHINSGHSLNSSTVKAFSHINFFGAAYLCGEVDATPSHHGRINHVKSLLIGVVQVGVKRCQKHPQSDNIHVFAYGLKTERAFCAFFVGVGWGWVEQS